MTQGTTGDDARRVLRDAAILVTGLGLLVVFVLPMRLGGDTLPIVITGGSMLPTYAPGDLVIARTTDDTTVGDIAVVEVPSGGLVIHRVVAMTPDGPVTRGDALDWEDPWPVAETRTMATATGLRVPGFGQVLLSLAASPVRLAALCALVGGVVAAAWPATRAQRPDLRAAATAVASAATPGAVVAAAAALLLACGAAALV